MSSISNKYNFIFPRESQVTGEVFTGAEIFVDKSNVQKNYAKIVIEFNFGLSKLARTISALVDDYVRTHLDKYKFEFEYFDLGIESFDKPGFTSKSLYFLKIIDLKEVRNVFNTFCLLGTISPEKRKEMEFAICELESSADLAKK